jgi:hypothetical protein
MRQRNDERSVELHGGWPESSRGASRRRVLLALTVLTVVLLVLSGLGFSRLAAESGAGPLTSGEARLTASILLNLVMFSLIAALGTAFLAGLAQCLVVWATVGYWPPEPAAALALLTAQTVVLLTLAVLLSTLISPMASGVVAVGLFGTTSVGWCGGWHRRVPRQRRRRTRRHHVADAPAHRRPVARGDARAPGPVGARRVRRAGRRGLPGPSVAPLTVAYLAWAAAYVAIVCGGWRRRPSCARPVTASTGRDGAHDHRWGTKHRSKKPLTAASEAI